MTLSEGFDFIGHGQSLRVPVDGGPAEFMAYLPGQVAVPCPAHIAEQLAHHRSIFHMTESLTGVRSGWRDLGWPEGSDYYCMVV